MNTTQSISVQPTVSLYAQITSTGRHIRYATMVRFADGREVRFMARMGKRTAIMQAKALLEREAQS